MNNHELITKASCLLAETSMELDKHLMDGRFSRLECIVVDDLYKRVVAVRYDLERLESVMGEDATEAELHDEAEEVAAEKQDPCGTCLHEDSPLEHAEILCAGHFYGQVCRNYFPKQPMPKAEEVAGSLHSYCRHKGNPTGTLGWRFCLYSKAIRAAGNTCYTLVRLGECPMEAKPTPEAEEVAGKIEAKTKAAKDLKDGVEYQALMKEISRLKGLLEAKRLEDEKHSLRRARVVVFSATRAKEIMRLEKENKDLKAELEDAVVICKTICRRLDRQVGVSVARGNANRRLNEEQLIAYDTIHELAVDWQVQEMKVERLKNAMVEVSKWLDVGCPNTAATVLSDALEEEKEVEIEIEGED